jgi:hypothetical protein
LSSTDTSRSRALLQWPQASPIVPNPTARIPASGEPQMDKTARIRIRGRLPRSGLVQKLFSDVTEMAQLSPSPPSRGGTGLLALHGTRAGNARAPINQPGGTR